MKSQHKKNAAEIAAQNETPITPVDLLQEIEPLLREFLIGKFFLTENAIIIRLKNGQNFSLTVRKAI